MPPTRRDFIRYIGLFLASAVARSCGMSRTLTARPTPSSPYVGCYLVETVAPETVLPPSSRPADARWDPLRDCWYSLDDPRVQSYEDNDFIVGLRGRHQEALDVLVAAGELDAAVAEEIAVAFGQAVAHIQRNQVECYIALPLEYYPREDLLAQAAALEELAAQGNLDPAVVEQARAALARDIEWLSEFQAGRLPGLPEDVEPNRHAVEAAWILVELLLNP